MTNSEPMVRFENVQKSYDGDTLVVKDLNLDVAKGEFLTMLGPSGSGKTTSLMMLAGFEPATHGEIWLGGKSINHIAPHKRGIGMVFQNYALFPHMTIAENLAFPLQVRGLSRSEIESRVNRSLDMVKLSGFGDRRPGQLSGGQQQRIAVARALIFEPIVVLMDEPLGALDKNLREQMQYEIKALHDRLGITMVYVTHDQSEALILSDRIAVFNDGEVQQLSSPSDLYERPCNAFVAQFIGENNKLLGSVESFDGAGGCKVRLVSGESVIATPIVPKAVGERTLLSIRPERILLNPEPDAAESRIKGSVSSIIYHGDHMRVYIKAAGHDDLIVKVPNDAARRSFKVGEAIDIGWARDDCRALDAA